MNPDDVRSALLQKNYFPNHRKHSPEIPPFFHSNYLTPQVADKIVQSGPPTHPYKGCDYVQYALTRFNGGPRICGIPHPYAYCMLVSRIHKEWYRIEPKLESDSSIIRAHKHKDGRLFVMDYGSHQYKSQKYLEKQSCSSFIAKADIANFYPSLYTHAIPWAIVGIDSAKNSTNNSIWYNALDREFRNCRRSETNGVLVGPGTSSIAAEIILCEIDRKLQKTYNFHRYIDDYSCYAKTREEAGAFISSLERELAKFNLYLNFNKTLISESLISEIPNWIDQLRAKEVHESPSFYQSKIYLSRLVHIAESYPEASVLKYGFHAIKHAKFDLQTGRYVLRKLLGIALTRLHLIPCIFDFVKFGLDIKNNFLFSEEMRMLVRAAAKARRSDAISWSLYLCQQLNIPLSSEDEFRLQKTYDPTSLVLLYEVGSPQIRRTITNFTKKRILNRPSSVIQKNWILVHYLLNNNRIKVADVNDSTLKLLKTMKVNMFG